MTELCEFLIRLLRLHCHEQIPKDQTEVFFFHPVSHEFITEAWLVYLRIFGSTPFKATAATQVTAAFSTAFGIKILSIV